MHPDHAPSTNASPQRMDERHNAAAPPTRSRNRTRVTAAANGSRSMPCTAAAMRAPVHPFALSRSAIATRKLPVPHAGSHALNAFVGRAVMAASSTRVTVSVGVYQVPARRATPLDSAARFTSSYPAAMSSIHAACAARGMTAHASSTASVSSSAWLAFINHPSARSHGRGRCAPCGAVLLRARCAYACGLQSA